MQPSADTKEAAHDYEKNSWAALLEPVESKQPGRSSSARAKAHDWASLLDTVNADSLRYPTLDFEEHYVHAIQKALEGRDNGPLLKLLDSGGRLLHLALMPALADAIRSQTDGARGRPNVLTHHQARMIREFFDKNGPFFFPDEHPDATVKWLASAFKTTPATIERSLSETKEKAK
jgi:hypothetical protein